MESLVTENDDVQRDLTRDVQFSYFAELNASQNQEELKYTIHDIVKRLGFSDYSVTNLRCAAEPQFQLSSLPVLLVSTYHEKRLFTEDMVLQRAINNSEPFLSSLVYEHVNCAPYSSDMTKKMAAIYELNKSFGYYDSYNIPHQTHNSCLMLSVVGRGISPVDYKKRVKDTKQSLHLLMDAVVFILTHRFTDILPISTDESVINPKPLRVLDALANNDLTIEQVAQKLCISVVTANQHLKTVKNKLSVKSNYASIRHCILAGMIKYDEAPKLCMKMTP